ncbi:hypothetical protein [Limnoglobus roseus]|uniref:Uncharacterized protein n=1 Tax=Limnoglobus roseus TaxID=2598579 RepID=A0A5C1AF13_9BACT|nr:hypothetical protein [Limnoglobus roseus]QEL16312.1 hypothetical protein PX52LOC_03256 [Limnoglobus roseus]
MKTSIWAAGLVALFVATDSWAADKRRVLMECRGEYGGSVGRPSKIDGEAEGRVLALAAVNASIDGMANIEAFEQFSKADVKKTLSGKPGDLLKGTISFSTEDKKEELFKGNRRGLVVTVQEKGFKPGTFTHSSDYNKLTGVRKSKASGVLLYSFTVYAPEGYDPNGGAAAGNKDVKKEVRYTIRNDAGRAVRFDMQPSGKSYTLDAGRTFTGTSYEVNGKLPTITLGDSGRTYKLTAGNHKFWWMSGEKRVGFDRSTD